MIYGVPYKGGKSKIAREIVEQLPEAENFYDLFAGGCAISHAAILSGKYKHVYCNDLDWRGPQLFLNAIEGKYKDERRWISREDFERLKGTDPYVALCWSFGYNGKDYMYGRSIEPYKKATFEVVAGNTLNDRRLAWRHNAELILTVGSEQLGEKSNSNSLRSLQSLECLERLERLNSLSSYQRPIISSKDYRDIEIKPDSIIYCDIPYSGTDCYNVGDFCYAEFYIWASNQSVPVYVSEKEMPDNFREVWHKDICHTLCATNNAYSAREKLFVAA